MTAEWYNLIQGYNLMVRSINDRLYPVMIFVLFFFPSVSSLAVFCNVLIEKIQKK